MGAIGLLLSATPLAAQDPADRAEMVAGFDLPAEVAESVVDFFNDPRRVQYRGPVRIEAGDTVEADVAVLEGPLEVAGRILGSVVVVNGDVRLLEGASITGDVLVVGGRVEGAERARVGGQLTHYEEALRYREEGGRIRRVPETPARPEAEEWGRADFLITSGRSYNRVEGLPISFGPRVQTAGSNPLRVHALGIYRTESGLTLDTGEMGYSVRVEQFLGGRRTFRVGGSAYSTIEPIEDWHLSDLENGLATFVLHRDFRDHYEREGVSAYATVEPRHGRFGLTVEGRWEEHGPRAAGSPWSLVNNADPWRPQPLAAQGDLRSAAVDGWIDTRSSAVDPATGWLVRGRVERGVADLVRAQVFQEVMVAGARVGFAPVALPELSDFATGLLDIRRYNRVNPESRLNFRLLAAGSLDDAALPPQRQHTLGGEGSLPGFPFFEHDCGARSGLVFLRPDAGEGTPYFPNYGCDAIALLQAEFRGRLSLGFGWDDDIWNEGDDWNFLWDIAPEWSLFLDAGRGWSYSDDRTDEELAVDAGVGILFERLGVYVAAPLTGGGRGLNLFVRIGPRF